MANASTRFYLVTALVLLIGGLIVVSLLQPVFGTRADFSMYNTRWNGASDVAGDLYGTGDLVPTFSLATGEEDITLAHRSFSGYEVAPREHTLLVLAPSKDVTDREAAWLSAFVDAGGRLVVADNFGTGNAFLEAAGASTRIEGDVVADLAYSKQPPFVVVTDVEDHPATGGARELLLDYGSTLEVGPNASVLARTGASAWLDADENMVQDPEEATGPFALAATERVGNGTVLAVSDPSLYVNGMREHADNAQAARGLVTWATENDRQVLIDEAHRDYPDPVRFAGATIAAVDETTTWVLATLAFGLFAAFALGRPETWLERSQTRLRGLLGRLLPEPSEEEHDPIDIVVQRHPGWNETTLREVRQAWEEDDGDPGARGRA